MDSGKNYLMPGVSKREVLAWASYDFANSGYTTVILTAVYNAFFVSVVAENAVWATFAWTLTITLSNLLSIAVIPVISALADAQANKRFWRAVMTGICCMSTATLAYTGPGTLASAVFLIVISNTAFNAGVSLNSAFLSELAKPEAFGKVSGWGWSFGYLGGIVSLAACLLIVFEGQKAGLPADVYVPYTAMSTATIFFVMALPMLLYVKERSKPKNISFEKTFKRIRQESVDSFKLLKRYPEFLKFCVCGLFYQAGIAVVITLSAVYAQLVMKFTTAQTITLILVVNITAAIGAFVFGYVQDRLGHKKTLALTILLWIIMGVMAAFSHGPVSFWIAANIAGIAMGSSQSAGRAVVAVFAPAGELAQFYSAWNVAVWGANVLGPITYGTVTWLTSGDQRTAILVTTLFFVIGLLILRRVHLPSKTVC